LQPEKIYMVKNSNSKTAGRTLPKKRDMKSKI